MDTFIEYPFGIGDESLLFIFIGVRYLYELFHHLYKGSLLFKSFKRSGKAILLSE